MDLHLSDVTILPTISNVSSRKEVDLICKYQLNHKRLEQLPIIVSNMDSCGTIEMAKALYPYKIGVALHKYIDKDKLIEFFKQEESDLSWYTIGMNGDFDRNKLMYVNDNLKSEGLTLDRIHIDTPNGYLVKFHDFVKSVRQLYPEAILMAGNICTGLGALELTKCGVNIIKVGIAQGGWCDTKNKASIGVPQLLAIKDVNSWMNSELKNEFPDVLICSDGGVKTPAHIANSIAAGSHFSMCGSLFMGYNECNEDNWEYEYEKTTGYVHPPEMTPVTTWTDVPPERAGVLHRYVEYTGKKRPKRLRVYGMSSFTANQKYNGGLLDYKTSEGKEGWVEPKGPVSQLAMDIRGSLASTCTYTNCQKLQDLIGYGKFVSCKN